MAMAIEEDLGLSLSLASPSMPEIRHRALPPPLKHTSHMIMPPPAPAPATTLASASNLYLHHRSRICWPDLLPHSVGDARSFLKGIGAGVNRQVEVEREIEDDAGVSPNSTLYGFASRKRAGETDLGGGSGSGSVNGELADRSACYLSGGSDEEDNDGGGEGSGSCRKKLRLTRDQSAVLEESFKEHNTLNPKEKVALARRLSLRPRQVEVWFQNRRARTKLKQTEVDCEYLKRCCEDLTEENRRLQKELAELRVLKLSPQSFYMHMSPPTTLTMCPSCERVQHAAAAAGHSSPPPPWISFPIRPSAVHASAAPPSSNP